MQRWLPFAFLLAGLLWIQPGSAAPIHHDLDVVLYPDDSSIEVRDTITLPDDHRGSLSFDLHPQLRPEIADKEFRLRKIPAPKAKHLPQPNETAHMQLNRYRVELPPGSKRFTLRYRGKIHHDLQGRGEEYARSYEQTQGIISAQGVFLAGSSHWVPQINDELIEFDLDLQLPANWKAMSQGERLDQTTSADTAREYWRCTTPQEEIYLIAAPLTEYSAPGEQAEAMVLLRDPDAELARRYLDTTHHYIDLYTNLIGPYPFTKFALVENFWETGYGMPSFTLLGSKVIRLPFILHSSYPHEILHNWWGNSVYVDYQSGNWAEGLTSYLADHLIKEQRGAGTGYRRNLLQKYTDYVDEQQDFPLTDFRSRHSARSEAVGYGKTLMLFHMLRRQLGDETFIRGLQSFYQQYRFRVAGFRDVRRSFSEVARKPLQDFFAQWVERAGAPLLQVSRARAIPQDDGYQLSAIIEQTQTGKPYTLKVPLAVHLDGVQQAWQTGIRLDQKRMKIQLDLPARPLRLDIDPEFDVFRRLHRDEIPPAISQALGADRVLVVLPAQATPELKHAYRALAESWQQKRPDQVEIAVDDTIGKIPDDRAVWLFGWNNRFRPRLGEALQSYDYEDLHKGVRINQADLEPEIHSLAVLGRHPRNPDQALGWLSAHSATALPGLGRKLPHYGRYSYLAFTGTAPDNVLKGQWTVTDSSMSIAVQQSDGKLVEFSPARLAPRRALATATAVPTGSRRGTRPAQGQVHAR